MFQFLLRILVLIFLYQNSIYSSKCNIAIYNLTNALGIDNVASRFVSVSFLHNSYYIFHDKYSFLHPNEYNLLDAFNLYRKIKKGVFISVGVERSFMSFSVSRASYGLFTDYDPFVVEYNRFVIGLLTISKNLKDFRYLKNEARFKEIQKRLKNTQNVKFAYGTKDVLKSKLAYKRFVGVWRRAVYLFFEKNSKFGLFNYHYNNKNYKRLSSLAKNARIEAHLIDLRNNFLLKDIISNIEASKLIVSAIDISNAWMPSYGIGKMSEGIFDTKNIDKFFKLFEPVLKSSSLFVMTFFYDNNNYSYGRVSNRKFNYMAVSASNYFKFYNSVYGTAPIYKYMIHDNSEKTLVDLSEEDILLFKQSGIH